MTEMQYLQHPKVTDNLNFFKGRGPLYGHNQFYRLYFDLVMETEALLYFSQNTVRKHSSSKSLGN